MALSCIPLSKIPSNLLARYQEYKNDNFILKSLKNEVDIFSRIIKLIDVEDTEDNKNDYGLLVWLAEKEARTNQEKNPELLKVFCFCLTDFWSCCFKEQFRKDHERTFWVENIVPKFKYLGSKENIVFSWCEDRVKSFQIDQIEKNFWLNTTSNSFSDGIGRFVDGQEVLIMESSSGYEEEDIQHNCKASSVAKLAVFSVQCIKDKLTLMETTADSEFKNYEIVELRSCTIPTAWKGRFGMLKLFELLACLDHELKEQMDLEQELLKQENQMILVAADESVRHVLRSGRLSCYFG